MFRLNSILKIVIVVFLSLVIPSFLSIFKISFDEYVSAQEPDVQGASIVRVQTVKEKDSKGSSSRQSVQINLALPRVGAINNQSQKPFKFPSAKDNSSEKKVNDDAPASYIIGTNKPRYIFVEDNGRGEKSFLLSFAGIHGDMISFYNGNDYDLNSVKIKIGWSDQSGIKFESIYATDKIQANLSFYENIDKTAEASIPFDSSRPIEKMSVEFTDNAGVLYIAEY